MSIDVVDLRNFYAQRLGLVARRFVGRGIRARFADTRGLSLLGVGYPHEADHGAGDRRARLDWDQAARVL